jgi:hypothetical protein
MPDNFYLGVNGIAIGPFASQVMVDRVSSLLTGKRDAGLAYDRAPVTINVVDGKRGLVFDKESMRFETVDGHMKLKAVPISKACVNPYYGKEIPGFEELGLDGTKIYHMLRDPVELAKGASTFDGTPLMIEHIPVHADEHPSNEVVGSIGTGVYFEDPYLIAPLSVWTREAIDGIEDDSKRELSSGYHYDPDMTPGTYKGEPYDGVMRNIMGNHVALVEKGRAGPDVVVGDNQLVTENNMPVKNKLNSRAAIFIGGALMAALAPKLAKDSKLDMGKLLAGVSRKALMAKDGKTIDAKKVKAVVKLAMDAAEPMVDPALAAAAGSPAKAIGPDDVIMKLVEHAIENATGGETDPMAAMKADDIAPPAAAVDPVDPAEVDPKAAKRKAAVDALCAGGMSEDDAGAMVDGLTAEDADKEDDDTTDDEEPPMKPVVTKKAMDKAIKQVVADGGKAVQAAIEKERANNTALNEARAHVEPLVGKVSLALDSAHKVYATALDSLGVKVDGITDVKALKVIFDQQATAKKQPLAMDRTHIAMDADVEARMAERFPHGAAIQNHG